MLKVMLVAPSFPPHLGGIETVVAALAQSLTLQGVEVDVYTQARGVDIGSQHSDGKTYEVHWFPDATASERFPVSPKLWSNIVRDASHYDVVHLHDVNSLATLAACTTRDVPLVLSPYFHGSGHSSLARLLHLAYDPMLKMALRRLSGVICISEAEAMAFCAAFPRLAVRVSHAHIAVDTAALRDAVPMSVTRPVILAAGRFVSYKQFDVLIRAFSMLDRSRMLVLLGTGEEEDSLRRLVDDLGLASSDVLFRGRTSDVELRRWYATAALFVSMSRHESFGLSVLQALVSGIPVVASDIPSHAELQRYARARFRLVPTNSSAETLRLALSEPGADRVPIDSQSQFPTWEGFARQVLRTYEAVRRSN